jgi:hypothetical protein
MEAAEAAVAAVARHSTAAEESEVLAETDSWAEAAEEAVRLRRLWDFLRLAAKAVTAVLEL